jgi:hypothetical protein
VVHLAANGDFSSYLFGPEFENLEDYENNFKVKSGLDAFYYRRCKNCYQEVGPKISFTCKCRAACDFKCKYCHNYVSASTITRHESKKK